MFARSPLGTALTLSAALAVLVPGARAASAESHTSKVFTGAKVDGGTVTHTRRDGKDTLTLSDDFKVPDTPDPHWQVVDSQGRVYLLQRLGIKGAAAGAGADRINRTITLPGYIEDIAKVQIYCSWAEAVLGETSFDAVMKLTE